MKVYLKLRNNIVLDSDLQLAERELIQLCGSYEVVTHSGWRIVDFLPESNTLSFVRKKDVIGYIVETEYGNIECLVKYLSFIQEIWYEEVDSTIELRPYECRRGKLRLAVPLMAMSEFLFYCKRIDNSTCRQILNILSGNKGSKDVETSICRTITSTPHVHSFHAYKAKFFPRFVRSLIVSNIEPNSMNINICDPFVGSGTTLVEASLLGFASWGIDIDPLSCMISRIKTDSLEWDVSEVYPRKSKESKAQARSIKYDFPCEIKKKFNRWGLLEEQQNYEQQISEQLNQINLETGHIKDLDRISLSDALTKKFNVRMMGTGSGRFALEIAKRPLSSILNGNYDNQVKSLKVVAILKEIYNLTLKRASVIVGDAVKRDMPNDFFDIIITSPPYLPASSGREDYVVGKLISMKAMGMLNDDDKEFFTGHSVGSMENVKDSGLLGLPKSVIQLYNWLINDELRAIKAKPIVSYYNSLKRSLLEDKRTIKVGGRIIYIIGKESVFYSLATKEILYKVECDKIFEEIAESVGLKIVDTIYVELDKKNVVARPRSTDKFYECAIIMSK